MRALLPFGMEVGFNPFETSFPIHKFFDWKVHSAYILPHRTCSEHEPRHILVDTLGLLIALVVHAANIQDYDGARQVLQKAPQKSSRLEKVLADGIYPKNGLVEWIEQHFQFIMEIVRRDKMQKGFVVLPKRWIVERTFAWFGRYRLLNREYEHLTQTSESDVYIASIRMMLQRLNRYQGIRSF